MKKFLFALTAVLGFSGLAQAADFSLSGAQFAGASNTMMKASPTAMTASLFDSADSFLQLRAGFDYSFMGDLGSGTDAYKPYAQDLGDTYKGGANGVGLQAGLLWGLHLDPANSLALDLGSVVNFGENLDITAGGNQYHQYLSPYLFSVSLDYILDIVKAPGAHTYITAGAGWYHAVVDMKTNFQGPDVTGSFSGDTVGGTLGVGEELDLGGSFGLNLSVSGRYAKVDKLTASSLTGTGTSGPYALAIVPTGTPFNQQVLGYDTTADIGGGSGARYANGDFSGIDADVALSLYL